MIYIARRSTPKELLLTWHGSKWPSHMMSSGADKKPTGDKPSIATEKLGDGIALLHVC